MDVSKFNQMSEIILDTLQEEIKWIFGRFDGMTATL